MVAPTPQVGDYHVAESGSDDWDGLASPDDIDISEKESGTVNVGTSSTVFTGTGIVGADGDFDGMWIEFTGGALTNERQIILTYTTATDEFTMVSGFSNTPANGDAFRIISRTGPKRNLLPVFQAKGSSDTIGLFIHSGTYEIPTAYEALTKQILVGIGHVNIVGDGTNFVLFTDANRQTTRSGYNLSVYNINFNNFADVFRYQGRFQTATIILEDCTFRNYGTVVRCHEHDKRNKRITRCIFDKGSQYVFSTQNSTTTSTEFVTVESCIFNDCTAIDNRFNGAVEASSVNALTYINNVFKNIGTMWVASAAFQNSLSVRFEGNVYSEIDKFSGGTVNGLPLISFSDYKAALLPIGAANSDTYSPYTPPDIESGAFGVAPGFSGLNTTLAAHSTFTTLTSNRLTKTATAITVTDGTGFADTNDIWIGSEKMTITAGGGTTSWTVARGVGGTTQVIHQSGDGISLDSEAVNITVAAGDNTEAFRNSGYLYVENAPPSRTLVEYLYYDSKTATSFHIVSRGAYGTINAARDVTHTFRIGGWQLLSDGFKGANVGALPITHPISFRINPTTFDIAADATDVDGSLSIVTGDTYRIADGFSRASLKTSKGNISKSGQYSFSKVLVHGDTAKGRDFKANALTSLQEVTTVSKQISDGADGASIHVAQGFYSFAETLLVTGDCVGLSLALSTKGSPSGSVTVKIFEGTFETDVTLTGSTALEPLETALPLTVDLFNGGIFEMLSGSQKGERKRIISYLDGGAGDFKFVLDSVLSGAPANGDSYRVYNHMKASPTLVMTSVPIDVGQIGGSEETVFFRFDTPVALDFDTKFYIFTVETDVSYDGTDTNTLHVHYIDSGADIYGRGMMLEKQSQAADATPSPWVSVENQIPFQLHTLDYAVHRPSMLLKVAATADGISTLDLVPIGTTSDLTGAVVQAEVILERPNRG